MWLISVNILLITVNLISALNRTDSQSTGQSSSPVVGLPHKNSQSDHQFNVNQISQLSHLSQQHSNQLLSQVNQFSQQQNSIQQQNVQQANNHNLQSQTTKLNQQQQVYRQREISCTDNQTISFIKYPNHKLSLNILNKLTEFTIKKLLNQTDLISSEIVERLHNSLNYNKPITQLCYNACKGDLECLAFAINYKQFTCYLIKEDYRTNGKDHLLFDTTSSWNFYEKICLNQVRTAQPCNQIWSFDIHYGGHLGNPSNNKQKQLTSTSLENCLNECRTNHNDTLTFKCRSVNYDSRKSLCTLNQHNRRIVPEAYITENQFTSMENLVYAENECVPFHGKCVFRHLPAYYLPDYQIYDMETNVNSLDNCEQLCINQSQYICRAFAYSKETKLCALSPEASSSLISSITTVNRRTNARRLEVLNPTLKLEKIQQQIQQKVVQQQSSFAYHERASCINVKIDCDANGMHAKVDTDGPFSGRLFTANNFEKCSKSNSDPSSEQINITIPLDANECGTIAAGNGTFSNRLILQYHPLILKESDRRIEISCDYHLVKQKVRGSKRRVLEGGGLSASQVITGLAESPPVKLKILNEEREEVRGAKLGDTLFFKVEISDEKKVSIRQQARQSRYLFCANELSKIMFMKFN